MAMSLCGARLAVPLSVAPQAQRSLAMRPSVAQPVMHLSAARPITPAAVRPVRTQSSRKGKSETRAPAPDLAMILGSAAVVVTIIGGLQAIVFNYNSALKTELTSGISVLNTKLDTNTASIREVNTKLDALTASVQTQQIETADLKGQVTILRDLKKK